MIRKDKDPREQRITQAGRLTRRSSKSGLFVSSSVQSKDAVSSVVQKNSKQGKMRTVNKVRASELIKALDEMERATTVGDVLSFGSKAKRILRLYRDSRKTCE